MTTAHVEKFAELVGNDPVLFKSLELEKVVDHESGIAVMNEIVNKAKGLGLQFTPEEGGEWLQGYIYKSSNGELSDVQLEAVAGGKGPYSNNGMMGTSGWITNGIHASMQQGGYGQDMGAMTSAKKVAGK